jgi:hypothetical protein
MSDVTSSISDSLNNAASPQPGPGAERSRSSLIEQHGSDVGEMLFEARMRVQEARRRQAQALRASLTVAREQLDRIEHAGCLALAPIEAEFTATGSFAIGEQYEEQLRANYAATVPLRNQIAEILRELNRPDPMLEARSRARDWKYVGGGEVEPAREFENTTVVHNVNWVYAGQGSAPPREFYNVPKNGPV